MSLFWCFVSFFFSLERPLRWMWTKDCEFWKEHLDATFVWDAAEALAAAALLAKDTYWVNKPTRGETHADGSVKAAVPTSLLDTVMTHPPLSTGEMKHENDKTAQNEHAGTPWEIGCARTQGQCT